MALSSPTRSRFVYPSTLMGSGLFFLILLIFLTIQPKEAAKAAPNIVFILIDDLGWDDVGFHGSEIKTPNIDKLAYEGVILNNYYVQPICTPTRAAFLTGKYPIHTGLQHYVIVGTEPYGLPLTEKILPQYLQDVGYSTHIVGKWHLGFFKEDYLPTKRGFESHYGYYMGHGDFFDHHGQAGSSFGLDFHHNGQPVWNESEAYSTEIFTRQAEQVIREHDQSKPLFLYLAHQGVHAGNQWDRIQAPQKYINRFPYIKDIKRRFFAGCVSAVDDSVGAVVKALQDAGMADNTIIVLSTDNGGPTNGYDGNAACNWPLRGCKNSMWQGGVRGVGLVNSPLLKKSGYVSEGMMHVVDWLPTLVKAAQRSEVDSTSENEASQTLSGLDGIDLWEEISSGITNSTWPRQEVLLNIDPISNFSSIIVGDMKLIQGRNYNGGWYPPPDAETYGDIEGKGKYFLNDRSETASNDLTFQSEAELFTKEYRYQPGSPVVVDCGSVIKNLCEPENHPCLFNLMADPCEYHNLASKMPDKVVELQSKILAYNKTMIPPGNKPVDPRGDPQYHGGVWGPWL